MARKAAAASRSDEGAVGGEGAAARPPARRKGSRGGKALAALRKLVPPLSVDTATRKRDEPAGDRPADAQRPAGNKQAQALPKPQPQPQPGVIRTGSLVKLASADKQFDGQVGRVIDMNVKFAHARDGLVSVLLAPRGKSQGVWVAVPPECLTLQ